MAQNGYTIFAKFYGDDVKAAGTVGDVMYIQVPFGSTTERLLLCRRNGFFGCAEASAYSRLDFDKHKHLIIGADNIYFAVAPESKVLLENRVSM